MSMDRTKAKTRRLEINQMTLGTGVVIFGIWSLIRMGLTLFIFNDGMDAEFDPDYRTLSLAIVWVATILLFLLYAYVGLSARSEGRGKRKSVAFLIWSGFALFLYIISLVFEVSAMFEEEKGIFSMVASLIIDITSIVCMLEMMVGSVKLRKLRKAAEAEEKEVLA